MNTCISVNQSTSFILSTHCIDSILAVHFKTERGNTVNSITYAGMTYMGSMHRSLAISKRTTVNAFRIVVVVCVLCLMTMLIKKASIELSNEVYIPGFAYIIKDNYPDPGIYEAEEFPADGKVRIPKIIHQTWKTRHIPSQYVEWMRSWSKNHPDWKYMFWTDEAARDFIAEKYPHILPAYDGYLENIRRADAMRYAILHEYGGVYADLDMESLLPIDSIIRKYSCILPQEPYEHPIIDSNTEHLVINALMACRPKHPLMKKYVDNIPKYFHMWNVLDSTGPHYITLLYNEYVSSKQLSPTHKDGVYLAPSEYFFPTIDPAKFSYMKERCLNFENMSFLQKRGCVALKVRGLKRKPYAFSFTVHHWVHTYLHSKLFESYYDIFEIIPYAIIRKSEGYVYHMVQ